MPIFARKINSIRMKNSSKIALFMLCVAFALTSCKKDTLLSGSQIPNEITSYVSNHFPSKNILQVMKERDAFELEYTVILSKHYTLEFNRKKEIKEIEGINRLPNSVVPSKILSYTQAQHPNDSITKWKWEDKKHQEIILNKTLEVNFDAKGNFLNYGD